MDNPGTLKSLVLAKNTKFTSEHRPDLLNGVTVVKGKAKAVIDGDPSHDKDVEFTAVPYYAWDNRAPGQMVVWLAEDRSVAALPGDPNLSFKASYVHVPIEALDERIDPANSLDASNGNLDFWPHKATTEWVQYDFKTPRTISQSDVYWFDDTGRGECRIPQSWRLVYKDGDEWKPVEAASEYGVKPNQFNHTTFNSVTTSALRMEIQLPEKFSAGVLRWHIK